MCVVNLNGIRRLDEYFTFFTIFEKVFFIRSTMVIDDNLSLSWKSSILFSSIDKWERAIKWSLHPWKLKWNYETFICIALRIYREKMPSEPEAPSELKCLRWARTWVDSDTWILFIFTVRKCVCLPRLHSAGLIFCYIVQTDDGMQQSTLESGPVVKCKT